MKPQHLALCALLALGCSKHEAQESTPPPTTTLAPAPVGPPVAPAAATAAAAEPEDDAAVVTADDLASEAAKEIGEEDLEKQLDAVEKEILKGP